MKHTTTFALFILIVSYLVSCNTDDATPLTAGEHDSAMIYREFAPPLRLQFDSTQTYRYGADTIDINLDDVYDIVIAQRLPVNLTANDNYTNDNYPYTRLVLNNGVEVATKIHNVPMPHDDSHVETWVDTLQINTPIDKNMDWMATNYFVNMWVVAPSNSFQGTTGTWYNITNEERFVGIRIKMSSGYKYGWLKIRQNTRDNIEIVSSAIEK
ncbi:hypothetical protein [uncultured Draconibacterium sp.]|uniref:hypothetical protein n=1 Tax=uncultured Draconibacterium sp. TaxID=1573823 RepID=UPI002AA7AF48|nr:hypothetical protein [uncultured Draconibacterium sp.]